MPIPENVNAGSRIEVEVRSVDAYEVEDERIKRSWGGYPDLESIRQALTLQESSKPRP